MKRRHDSSDSARVNGWYERKPHGRYNQWGQRDWLQVPEETIQGVDKDLGRLKLSPRARSLYQAATYTDSKGIEFVFISNAQFGPVVFAGTDIHIVPCFTPIDPFNPKHEKSQAAMMKWGQFIYDGWVPNTDWSARRLEEIVSSLDDVVSLFSIVGTYYAYWEPKYPFPATPVPSHVASSSEFQALDRTVGLMAQLPQRDRDALSRSLAWIAAGVRTPPVQRFLLLFVSIEALATYIESSKTARGSVLGRRFAARRGTASERRKRREKCVQTVFDHRGVSAEAVQEAYFKCLYTSIREMLEDHLNRVFGTEQASNTLFSENVDGKTLWQLRNDMAHGNLDLVSEQAARFLSARVPVLEEIARSYLRRILAALARAEYFSEPRRPILTLRPCHAFGSPGTKYIGPTDMAEYYANIEALSSSYIQMGWTAGH